MRMGIPNPSADSHHQNPGSNTDHQSDLPLRLRSGHDKLLNRLRRGWGKLRNWLRRDRGKLRNYPRRRRGKLCNRLRRGREELRNRLRSNRQSLAYLFDRLPPWDGDSFRPVGHRFTPRRLGCCYRAFRNGNRLFRYSFGGLHRRRNRLCGRQATCTGCRWFRHGHGLPATSAKALACNHFSSTSRAISVCHITLPEFRTRRRRLRPHREAGRTSCIGAAWGDGRKAAQPRSARAAGQAVA